MSRKADASKVAVQVEVDRVDVWVEDGRSPASYPVDGVPLRDLLAMPPNTILLPTTNPIPGFATMPSIRQDETLSNVTVIPNVTMTKSGTGSNAVVTDVKVTATVERETSRTLGPTLMQTKFPTPVAEGDQVSFAGRFGMRRVGMGTLDEDGNQTGHSVRVSLWGMSSNTDEYGVVEETAVELLAYETIYHPRATNSYVQVLITIPTVSAATVPPGVTGVHLTVGLKTERNGRWYATSYNFPYRGPAYEMQVSNIFTHATTNPLRMTVVPKTPPAAGVPAAEWETLTQEQNRLHRYTYEDITDHVNEITTEQIEAELAVTTVRLISTEVPAKVVAGKRVRVLALHPDGSFTVLAAGTIRSRRIVEDGIHPSQVEIGVHNGHGRLGSMTAGVAFDTFDEYAPVLNRAGIPAVIDGVEVTGPARDLPAWGGVEPSYRSARLSMLDALLMTRNTRKGFIRLDRNDRLEVLSSLPEGVAMDVSDQPGEGDASFSIDAEFGSDTTDLINQVAVTEHLMDSEDFERSTTNEDPPLSLGHMKSRTQTAEYRRPAAIATYGLASKMFKVVRGTGNMLDIEAGSYGTSFSAWAAAILDEYSIERSGPKSITIPVDTDAQWALVSKLEVLDAIVVRFRGVSYVRRIRRVTHKISPGGLRKALLRFDVTGEQVYWLPDTPVPLITLGDTDAGTIFAPSKGLVDGGHPDDTVTHLLDGGTL
ncbi:hypothetical protein CH305_03145 [Rhodococcus sp. 15-649-2-2]|uniref:hypothetical protein n=1 Tax=Rhodococcus sp. 15-649-2-2 TaxID=2023140 RepID=UPI000B9A6C59|nr:hypothetical protein [Rhodococcus sp. 15-649-2-2]OZE86966.1 hypothetical protein CH305_03145 [Rhodococcus sp. 15-649-2-2]